MFTYEAKKPLSALVSEWWSVTKSVAAALFGAWPCKPSAVSQAAVRT